MEVAEPVVDEAALVFDFPSPKELRPPLIVLENVSVGYALGEPVLTRLNLRIDPDDRLALVGRNGNGKTTLARLLAGQLKPMGGTIAASGKLQVGYFAQHQIEELVPEATPFQHMRHTAEQRSLSLIVDIEPGIPELPADKRACKQMLLNVISNAIKFTDPGGWVRVSAKVVGRDVVLSVADNGIGIAEADLPKLGKPFVQANNSYDRSYDGAGLGLSVVKGLAKLHSGKLELASTLGSGTTASILLPIDSASESVEAPMPKVSAA